MPFGRIGDIVKSLTNMPLAAALAAGRNHSVAHWAPLIIMGSGLHDVCYGGSLESIERELASLFRQLAGARIIWRSSLAFHFHPWGAEHQQLTWVPLCPFMTPQRVARINAYANKLATRGGHAVWDTSAINRPNYIDGRDGTHVCFFDEADAAPEMRGQATPWASLDAVRMPANRQCHVFMQTLLVLVTHVNPGWEGEPNLKGSRVHRNCASKTDESLCNATRYVNGRTAELTTGASRSWLPRLLRSAFGYN